MARVDRWRETCWPTTCAFAAIGLVALAVLTGAGQGPRTVVADRFVLQDDAGNARGQWWVEGGTAKFALYDAAGNTTIQANAAAAGGGAVALHGPDGKLRASLALGADGDAALSLKAGNQFGAVAGHDGAAGWLIRDRDGKVRAGVGLSPAGEVEEQ